VPEVLSNPGIVGWMAGVALILLLALVMVRMMRSRKPDPKMQLLLSLMKDFPRAEESEHPFATPVEDADPRKEHGPLGPNGFSHIA
jgi:hypothetical protein